MSLSDDLQLLAALHKSRDLTDKGYAHVKGMVLRLASEQGQLSSPKPKPKPKQAELKARDFDALAEIAKAGNTTLTEAGVKGDSVRRLEKAGLITCHIPGTGWSYKNAWTPWHPWKPGDRRRKRPVASRWKPTEEGWLLSGVSHLRSQNEQRAPDGELESRPQEGPWTYRSQDGSIDHEQSGIYKDGKKIAPLPKK